MQRPIWKQKSPGSTGILSGPTRRKTAGSALHMQMGAGGSTGTPKTEWSGNEKRALNIGRPALKRSGKQPTAIIAEEGGNVK